MKGCLRRFVYLLIVIVWLLIMSVPVLAVMLATQREVQIGDTQRHFRLFLIQESDSEGISVDLTRPAGGGRRCAQSNVIYLMWKGSGENTVYCQCYDENGAVISSERVSCSAHSGAPDSAP